MSKLKALSTTVLTVAKTEFSIVRNLGKKQLTFEEQFGPNTFSKTHTMISKNFTNNHTQSKLKKKSINSFLSDKEDG